MIRKTIALAIVLAAAPSAFARDTGTPPAATVEATSGQQDLVTYADLDLRDPRAQRILSLRVMQTAEQLCIRSEGKLNVDMHMGGEKNSCKARTYRQAQGQIDDAIRFAASGEQMPDMAVITLGATSPR